MADMNGKEHRLPDGWRWARLGEVGRFESGGTPSKESPHFWGGGIPFVTGADITDLYISSRHARAFLTNAGLTSGKTAICDKGVVLLVTRTRVGRVGIATEIMGVSQDLSPFICGPLLLPEYVCRYLMSIAEYLLDNCRGATIQGLTRDFVHALRIPLPPLPEQRRIAAILQEQLDALERARAATEAQLEAANALPAAYLRSVFNSPEAREWPRKSLGEMLSSPLKTGISKPTIPISDKWCLSLAAVRNGALDLSACKPVEVSDREAGGNWVKPGAFYVVRGNGNLSLVGRGALAPTEIKSPVLYPDLLIEVNPNPELIEPIFLRWAWDSQKVRSDIESRARTAAGIYKINQTNLASVCIPVPDLKVEKRLAAILSEQTTEVERLRKSLEAQLDAINKLPAALLRRAFRGELG